MNWEDKDCKDCKFCRPQKGNGYTSVCFRNPERIFGLDYTEACPGFNKEVDSLDKIIRNTFLPESRSSIFNSAVKI